MDAVNWVVGKECKTKDIGDAIFNVPELKVKLQESWRDLVRELELGRHDNTYVWNQSLKLDNRIEDVFYGILAAWVQNYASKATLGKFIGHLDNLHWNQFSAILRKKFGLPTPTPPEMKNENTVENQAANNVPRKKRYRLAFISPNTPEKFLRRVKLMMQGKLIQEINKEEVDALIDEVTDALDMSKLRTSQLQVAGMTQKSRIVKLFELVEADLNKGAVETTLNLLLNLEYDLAKFSEGLRNEIEEKHGESVEIKYD